MDKPYNESRRIFKIDYRSKRKEAELKGNIKIKINSTCSIGPRIQLICRKEKESE